MSGPYEAAVAKAREAVCDAINACGDTTIYPMINRQALREVADTLLELAHQGAEGMSS